MSDTASLPPPDQITEVVFTFTMVQHAPNHVDFVTRTDPPKDELAAGVLRNGLVSPLLAKMVMEMLISLRQFENRLSETGTITGIDNSDAP